MRARPPTAFHRRREGMSPSTHAHRPRAAAAAPAVLLLLLGAGCATPAGREAHRVDGHLLLPEGAQTVELEARQGFLLPEPLPTNRLPAHPLDAATGHSEVVVCVTFTVDADGRIEGVEPLESVSDCPGGGAAAYPAFLETTLQAVAGWQFFAAALCEAPLQSGHEHACDDPGARVEPVAVRLAWRFAFTGPGEASASALGRR